MNNRDELSCIVIENDVYNDVLQIPYDIGQLLTAPRIGFIIKGRPTWVQNKNAATGHSGTLLRRHHKGVRPESGVNKAPSKMHGGGLPWHALNGVILDEEDADNYGLFGWNNKDPNKNNEALIDNWECTHVIRLIKHTDSEDTITDEYHQMIDEVFQKCKERWPSCELIDGEID